MRGREGKEEESKRDGEMGGEQEIWSMERAKERERRARKIGKKPPRGCNVVQMCFIEVASQNARQ